MKAAASSSEELRDGQVNQGQKQTGLSTVYHLVELWSLSFHINQSQGCAVTSLGPGLTDSYEK